MSDTVNLDIEEKVNVLYKSSLGFPSAEESRQWYEETTVPFNNYIIGENIFLDEVPSTPDFDISGIVRTATEIGLTSNDFEGYSADSTSKSNCSIVDDSTGTIRRYNLLILEETPELSKPYSSWYKLNGNSENIIKDALQFNYKQYVDNSILKQPYLYKLNTQNSLSSPMPFGKFGGNWLVDFKSGILLFSDIDNFTNGTQTNSSFQVSNSNKPVLSIYIYIGRKGLNNMITYGDDVSEITNPLTNQIFINSTTNFMLRYDGTQWVSIGGSSEVSDEIDLKAPKENPTFTGNAYMDGGYIKQFF
tara:strand:- start:11533 stop:12444 length:912 start_codon:yes stop_codon:yes gene_type:complete